MPITRTEGNVNVSFWLKVNTIVLGLFGLGFLIAPSALGSSYAGGVNATTELALRYVGAAFLVLGIVSWFAAGAGGSSLQRWIVRAFALYAALGLVLDFTGMSSGVMTSMGYLNVAIDVIFLVAFGYFGFMRSETQ